MSVFARPEARETAVQWARVRGVGVGFWEYLRVGAPLTILTILVGLWWL